MTFTVEKIRNIMVNHISHAVNDGDLEMSDDLVAAIKNETCTIMSTAMMGKITETCAGYAHTSEHRNQHYGINFAVDNGETGHLLALSYHNDIVAYVLLSVYDEKGNRHHSPDFCIYTLNNKCYEHLPEYDGDDEQTEVVKRWTSCVDELFTSDYIAYVSKILNRLLRNRENPDEDGVYSYHNLKDPQMTHTVCVIVRKTEQGERYSILVGVGNLVYMITGAHLISLVVNPKLVYEQDS